MFKIVFNLSPNLIATMSTQVTVHDAICRALAEMGAHGAETGGHVECEAAWSMKIPM